MNKENFRFFIKVHTALNIRLTIIHDELHCVFGDKALSFQTVARWSHWFRKGREEVEDKDRSGRPITVATVENIEQIQSIISDDPHVTIEEVQTETGLSHGTIHRIISDHLELKEITARYIPKLAERVRIWKQNLEKSQQGTWRLRDVLTGDESWFNYKQIGRKSSNAA